jgi:hypothetical protein
MLTDVMRRAMAARVNDFLRERCTVAREVVTTGDYGQSERSWVVVAEDVPCRLIRPQYQQRMVLMDGDGRELARQEYGLILPLESVSVQVKDRVTVAGRALRVTRAAEFMTDMPFQRVLVGTGEAGA